MAAGRNGRERAGPSKPARPRRAPPGDFTVREVRDLMVDKQQVLAAIGDGGGVHAQCAGAAAAHRRRRQQLWPPGRIAGSVNLPAAHLLNPETNAFLPADELRRRFAGVGAMDRPVITYCGGGIAASADALALVMLGHENVQAVRRIAIGMGGRPDPADGDWLIETAGRR